MGLMLPILLIGGGYLGYNYFSKKTPPLQSLRKLVPGTNTPVQIVVPAVTTKPISGIVQQVVHQPSATITPTSPVVITTTGGSNLSVQTIQDIQRALNTLGIANPPLVVDGKIGPLSTAAIKSFQFANNIAVDGNLTAETKSAIQNALANVANTGNLAAHPDVMTATAASAAAMNVNTTKDVQHALNMLGASPALTEDGVIGPKTTAAIKAFQISHGLTSDGVAGPQTKTALSLALAGA